MVRRLLYLNGAAILGVLLFHAAGWGFVAMFAWTDRYLPVSVPNYGQMGGLAYYLLRAVEQVVVATIPAFLFVSGYFVAFATGCKQDNIGWPVIWARLKHRLTPYLFWAMVTFALFLVQGIVFPPGKYVRLLLTGSMTPAYYYVPLLVQLYLLSPLIVSLAKRRWVLLLVVAALIQLVIHATQLPLLIGLEMPALVRRVALIPKWFFPARLLWFVLGVLAGFYLTQWKQFLARVKWWLLVAAIILIPLGVIEWEYILHSSRLDWVDHRETLLDSIYSVCIILSFLAFDKGPMPFTKLVSNLGSKSFGIYLAHIPVMQITARGIYHVIPRLLGSQVLFQPIMIGLGLIIPLTLMMLANRTPARRFYAYVFG